MNPIGKTILIRPGALGDVLVAVPVLRYLKEAGASPLTLLAPAARGKFLNRPGFADEFYDWDSALFFPLFQSESEPLPERLLEVFKNASLVVSLAGTGDPESDDKFNRRLREAAPAALVHALPAAPADPARSAYRFFLDSTRSFCAANGFGAAAGAEPMDAAIPISLSAGDFFEAPYFVMHPGSGSRKKNWPAANFASLAEKLLALRKDGAPAFSRLVVTAGEADGELGEALAGSVPGAALCRGKTLEELAGVLSRAALYVGNDSGVSHLAATVTAPSGTRPRVAAIFGPTNPAVWRPRNALVIGAGEAMDACSASRAYECIVESFYEKS